MVVVVCNVKEVVALLDGVVEILLVINLEEVNFSGCVERVPKSEQPVDRGIGGEDISADDAFVLA